MKNVLRCLKCKKYFDKIYFKSFKSWHIMILLDNTFERVEHNLESILPSLKMGKHRTRSFIEIFLSKTARSFTAWGAPVLWNFLGLKKYRVWHRKVVHFVSAKKFIGKKQFVALWLEIHLFSSQINKISTLRSSSVLTQNVCGKHCFLTVVPSVKINSTHFLKD